MAGGNRQFWVVTTLIALPTLLGVPTFSVGQSPAVVQAVGRDDAPGRVEPVGGLLSEIFGGGSSSRSGASSSAAASERGPVNWDGIPTHSPQPMSPAANPTPIRDPGAARTARLHRDPAAPSRPQVPMARPIPPRSTPTSAVATGVPVPPQATPPINANAAAAEAEPDPTLPWAQTPLSSQTSSRRTTRRPIKAADGPPRMDSLGESSSPGPFDSLGRSTSSQNRDEATQGWAIPRANQDLVPKVARREVSSRSTPPEPATSSRRTNRSSTPPVSTDEPATESSPRPSLPPSLAAADADPQESPSDLAGSASDVPYAASSPRVTSRNVTDSASSGDTSGLKRTERGAASTVPTAEVAVLGPAPPSLSSRRQAASDPFRKSEPQPPAVAENELPPATSSVASELPGIRVTTSGPGQVMIRQSKNYEIMVENRGSVDVRGLLVETLVPDWANVQGHDVSQGNATVATEAVGEKIAWTIDRVAAGQSAKLQLQLQAVRSGTFDLDVRWTLQPLQSIATVHVQEPRLQLSIDGPEEVVYGESRTYQVRVLNPGDGLAPNVVFVLSPDGPSPQSQPIGDIPAGKEAEFEFELTAQDRGELKIRGLVTGDLQLKADALKTIRVTSAELEAVLSGPQRKYQDTEATYLLQLENRGTAASEQLAASLRLPPGVEYLGGIEGAALRGNQLRWEISALSPGVTRDYEFRCLMKSTGNQGFAFDCQGTAGGAAKVMLQTEVTAVADLVMSVDDPPAPAPVGRDVPYQIVIRNRGSKAATDVKVVAQFSHGIEPRQVEGQTGEILPGQVVFEPIESIEAGDQVVLQVIANAESAGNHRFRTEVRSGDILLVSEEATRFLDHESERISRRSSSNHTGSSGDNR